jgi:hypothetical protein
MSNSPDGLPEWSAEERSLWDSARDDRPPAASMGATLRAVGVGSALVTAAGVAQGAAAGTSSIAQAGGALALLKWSGIVLLGGATAIGGAALYRHSQSAQPAAVQPPSANPSRAAGIAQPTQKRLSAAPDEVAVAPEARTTSTALPAQPLPAPVRASSEAASQPDIGQEIRSIDAARSALRRGDTAEALRALERYRADYGKNGSLGMEATVLRIEALLRGGNRAEGMRLANSFLASHPKSPYAPRIRALVDGKQL